MNRDSVNEYISWLNKFKENYQKYIESNQELSQIFVGTFDKLERILSGNYNNKSTEKDIIKLLKEIVKKFSAVYNANTSINKKLEGPRRTNKFKQDIFKKEIAILKDWLIVNIDNKELFPDFISIVMFVAKRRQMIEFLKLSKINNKESVNNSKYFEIFGKIRDLTKYLYSPLITSHAGHLVKEEIKKIKNYFKETYQVNFSNKYKNIKQQEEVIIYFSQFIPIIKYKYMDKTFGLTQYMHKYLDNPPIWKHTNAQLFPELFEIMNELYSNFLRSVNNSNNTSKKDLLPELYWLYMQTCPFERGSAAIGEILFSVLLRKYFKGCDFFISNGWNGNPEIIPDIYALHYELDHFKSIFWDQFTDCTGKPNPNINNVTANRLRREVIGL